MFRAKDFYQSGVNNLDPATIQSLVVEELVKEEFHLSRPCLLKPQLAPVGLDGPLHPRTKKLGGLACLLVEVLHLDCDQNGLAL